MKNSNFKIILIVICFILFVSLACNLTKKPDLSEAELAITHEETEDTIVEPPKIIEVEPEPTPTEKAEPEEPVIEESPEPLVEEEIEEKEIFIDLHTEPQLYFVEEFDDDLMDWSKFLMSGDESKIDVFTENGRLVFDLPSQNSWVYLLYDGHSYSNVHIETLADNLGKNTNNVSLICNYTERFGWYEFNISNGGKYDILIFSKIDGGYHELVSGGSRNLRMGRDVNTYAVTCQGNKLSLYINGVLEKEFTDKKFNLREGQVGLGVSSFCVIPVLVEFDYFGISEPYQ